MSYMSIVIPHSIGWGFRDLGIKAASQSVSQACQVYLPDCI